MKDKASTEKAINVPRKYGAATECINTRYRTSIVKARAITKMEQGIVALNVLKTTR